MYILHFVCAFISQWLLDCWIASTFGLLWILFCYEHRYINICLSPAFTFGYVSTNVIAGSYCNSMFNCLGTATPFDMNIFTRAKMMGKHFEKCSFYIGKAKHLESNNLGLFWETLSKDFGWDEHFLSPASISQTTGCVTMLGGEVNWDGDCSGSQSSDLELWMSYLYRSLFFSGKMKSYKRIVCVYKKHISFLKVSYFPVSRLFLYNESSVKWVCVLCVWFFKITPGFLMQGLSSWGLDRF